MLHRFVQHPFKATPHNSDCANAPSGFSSNKPKRCKQLRNQGDCRDLRGFALMISRVCLSFSWWALYQIRDKAVD